MTRYWVTTPYNSARPHIFNAAWQYDLENGTIALGWRELGDISDIESKSDLEERYRELYNDEVPQAVVARDVNAIWAFREEISPGDMVIARRGTKRAIGVGTVTGRPFYDEDRGQERVAHLTDDFYSRFLPVDWGKLREIEFERIVFSFYALYEISEEKYQDLVLKGSVETLERIEQSAEFALEKHLEHFIVRNFDRIFSGRLELYRDEGGIGQQYPIVGTVGKEIGCIDILATEPSTNSYVVIELKKGQESDRVIGQVLRYMGWVADNLCNRGEEVKGLIICKGGDERLDYALRLVQDIVEVKRYRIGFRLID